MHYKRLQKYGKKLAVAVLTSAVLLASGATVYADDTGEYLSQANTQEAEVTESTAGGLYLTMDELHKLGLLYLQNVNWNGKQLVPENWVKEATSKQVENDKDSFGYGYLFWGGRENTFRADGKYCQWSIISREKNAVITVIAECRRDQKLMDAVFTEVFPQV